MYYNQLPRGYALKKTINLRTGKLYMPLCALLNLVLFLAALAVTGRFVPLSVLYETTDGRQLLTVPRLLLALMWVAVGLLGYALVHLALRGGCLELLGHQRPKFGIKGFYYYVGSRAYFSRRRYVLLVLLPELIVEAGLIVLCLLLQSAALWPVAIVHAFHFSRLSTTLLLVLLVLREPRTALFCNMGTRCAVFSK